MYRHYGPLPRDPDLTPGEAAVYWHGVPERALRRYRRWTAQTYDRIEQSFIRYIDRRQSP